MNFLLSSEHRSNVPSSDVWIHFFAFVCLGPHPFRAADPLLCKLVTSTLLVNVVNRDVVPFLGDVQRSQRPWLLCRSARRKPFIALVRHV